MRRILHETYGNSVDEVYVEGNHDILDVEGIFESGTNDPASGAYGVFVIHEDDYMWGSNAGRSEKNAGSGKSAKDIISETFRVYTNHEKEPKLILALLPGA